MAQQPSDSTKNTDKIPHDNCSKEYFDNFGQWQGELFTTSRTTSDRRAITHLTKPIQGK